MTDPYADPLGDLPCPACKKPVMFAWDDAQEPVCLEPDDSGDVAVSEDANRIPWCRAAAGTQLAFDERLYRLHDPVCPGLAPVRPIGSAKSLRPRPSRPATPPRSASARLRYLRQ